LSGTLPHNDQNTSKKKMQYAIAICIIFVFYGLPKALIDKVRLLPLGCASMRKTRRKKMSVRNGKWKTRVNGMQQEKIRALISVGEQIVAGLGLPELQENAVEAAADTETEACLLWVIVLAGMIKHLSNQYGVTMATEISEEAIGAVMVFHNRCDKTICH
jgi:hypothetical protein